MPISVKFEEGGGTQGGGGTQRILRYMKRHTGSIYRYTVEFGNVYALYVRHIGTSFTFYKKSILNWQDRLLARYDCRDWRWSQ